MGGRRSRQLGSKPFDPMHKCSLISEKEESRSFWTQGERCPTHIELIGLEVENVTLILLYLLNFL